MLITNGNRLHNRCLTGRVSEPPIFYPKNDRRKTNMITFKLDVGDGKYIKVSAVGDSIARHLACNLSLFRMKYIKYNSAITKLPVRDKEGEVVMENGNPVLQRKVTRQLDRFIYGEHHKDFNDSITRDTDGNYICITPDARERQMRTFHQHMTNLVATGWDGKSPTYGFAKVATT